MPRSTHALLAAAIVAASLSPAVSMAQTAPAAQPPAQTQPAIKPSEAQLQKFASASQKVAVVADEYRPKLNAAKDEPAREKVYREADEKMVKAVQADGLTVDEFNGIGQAVEQDPQLRQRVIELAQKNAPAASGARQ
ncbi:MULTISPECIES: DUF4168 domain-containing protein [unclassified Bordetella]|uniref:DUF4168 domain-containing protein n=1 Tax=unclassified Bordetella TaxID=2630031 RepID=UPI00132272A8|nr:MULTISPECIES: DUF4168 domain-containing protein [unclassified Bordetella]MVW72060.1 DUF4168 domain-containing protein [Bordetella sp. 15P40C-2]MVW78773.1 DUF4168 domain-containing protein [Bordetella sp. 02P26C-1]